MIQNEPHYLDRVIFLYAWHTTNIGWFETIPRTEGVKRAILVREINSLDAKIQFSYGHQQCEVELTLLLYHLM